MVEADSSAAIGATRKHDIPEAVGQAFEHAVLIKDVAAGIRAIHDISERQKIGSILGRGDAVPEKELRALRKLAATQATFILSLAEQITEALFNIESVAGDNA